MTDDEPESDADCDVIIPPRVREIARSAMGRDIRFDDLETAIRFILNSERGSLDDMGQRDPKTGIVKAVLWAGDGSYIVELIENDDHRLNWVEVVRITRFPSLS